ncbi:MAG: SDR family NAD(P)-dependent oxidoreductase [Hyphomonadaceae bacterium]
MTYARYPSLAGRRVLITGGASGIGRAMAESFADQAARVVVLDRDEAAGQTLAKSVQNISFHACDVTDAAGLRLAIDTAVAELGALHVLIANAADDTRHSLDDVTPEMWDRCIAVNLKHQFFAVRSAYLAIAASGGGSIICMGSIAWLNNTTGMIGYTAAKAGVHGLVRTLARQLGPRNIRVNALLPGWTMTERQRELWVDEAAEQEIAAAQCLPGFVMPEDVARMALFLAADDSAMCTQQSFIVDGGWI